MFVVVVEVVFTHLVTIKESWRKLSCVVGSKYFHLCFAIDPLTYQVIVREDDDADWSVLAVHQSCVNLIVVFADSLSVKWRQVRKF